MEYVYNFLLLDTYIRSYIYIRILSIHFKNTIPSSLEDFKMHICIDLCILFMSMNEKITQKNLEQHKFLSIIMKTLGTLKS